MNNAINRAEIIPLHRNDAGNGTTYGALGVFINSKLIRQFPIVGEGEYSSVYYSTKLQAEEYLAAEFKRRGEAFVQN